LEGTRCRRRHADLLLGIARERRYAVVKLHAQTHAISFYARHGFNAVGADFLEAGIAHREMGLQLPPASRPGMSASL